MDTFLILVKLRLFDEVSQFPGSAREIRSPFRPSKKARIEEPQSGKIPKIIETDHLI